MKKKPQNEKVRKGKKRKEKGPRPPHHQDKVGNTKFISSNSGWILLLC